MQRFGSFLFISFPIIHKIVSKYDQLNAMHRGYVNSEILATLKNASSSFPPRFWKNDNILAGGRDSLSQVFGKEEVFRDAKIVTDA